MEPTPEPDKAGSQAAQDTEWGFWWATLIGLVGLICVAVLVWVTIRSFL